MSGPAAGAPQVLTVGHSTHPIERFLALLGPAGVKLIADVRRFPGSRRNPQFGAEALAASLAGAGIGYEGFGEGLGGRRSGGDAPAGAGPSSDNSAWRNRSFRAYADYMASDRFGAALAALEARARGSRTAIMCAEAHPSRCHRQLIADALLARGWRVVHLLADGRRAEHSLSPHAAVAGDRVSYPGQPSLGI